MSARTGESSEANEAPGDDVLFSSALLFSSATLPDAAETAELEEAVARPLEIDRPHPTVARYGTAMRFRRSRTREAGSNILV